MARACSPMFPSVSICAQDANYAYATWQGILTKIRACEHLCHLGRWTWQTVTEWIFHFLGRHFSRSRMFERMENFQNDCCRPWTKNPFKNFYSRHLWIVNGMITRIAGRQVRSIERNLFFFKLNLLILEWSQQLYNTGNGWIYLS